MTFVKQRIVMGLAVAGFALAAFSNAAIAQSDALTCSAIADPGRRLECYDAKVKTAVKDGEMATLHELKNLLAEKELQLRKLSNERDLKCNQDAKTQDGANLFGMPSPDVGRKELMATADGDVVRRSESGEVTAIQSRAIKWYYTHEGYVTVELENGQIWRQLEGRTVDLRPSQTGPRVRIQAALMGSFKMTVEGRNHAVRVKRIDKLK